MTDNIDTFFEAAQAGPTATGGQRIGQLVQQSKDLDNEIGAAEAMLAELKASQLELLTRTLPDAMAEAGTSKFTTANGGFTVEVNDHVSGSLASEEKSPDKRRSQIAYIVDHGGEGIVTADVVLKYGRTNRAAALETAKQFAERDDVVVAVKEDVHHSTLKAWGRERLKKGLPIDGDQCGLWIGKIAKITEAKD